MIDERSADNPLLATTSISPAWREMVSSNPDVKCSSFVYKCGGDAIVPCPEGCYSAMAPRSVVMQNRPFGTVMKYHAGQLAQIACVCPPEGPGTWLDVESDISTHTQSDTPSWLRTWRCADEPLRNVNGLVQGFTVADELCCQLAQYNDTVEGKFAWEMMKCPDTPAHCPPNSIHAATSSMIDNVCARDAVVRSRMNNAIIDAEGTAIDFRQRFKQ